MSPKVQRLFAWSAVPFVVFYLLGFAVIAGFLPPPSPMMTTAELVSFYDQNRTGIRAGQLIALFSAGLLLLWAGAITAQMVRIERGSFPLLSVIQYVAAALLFLLFILCSLIWTIAAYRPDLNPDTLRMLNDAGWLIFVMAIPEYPVQLGCIVVVCLSDKRPQPFLPRWACFATLFVALIGEGGAFATFFKSGPFAWNGLIGFWLPVIFFIVWLLGIMLPFLLKAINRQAAEEALAA